jgi:tetraacyldisaccharide 4'-kinase
MLLRLPLWPFSLLYGTVARLRALCYRTGIRRAKRLNGIVISVGNLTVGGTGKTPMVIFIAQRLASEGQRVAVLTRGYRGKPLASPAPAGESQPPASSSDEVAVMQAHLGDEIPIGVGADRFAEGRKLEKDGINYFVLDDGFQHLQLARDVDVLLIDAMNPFDGGFLLPAGRLREPVSAMRRANVVVITRSERAPAVESMVRRHTSAPVYYAQTELKGAFRLEPRALVPDVSDHFPKHPFAFCGIGNPGAFFSDLRRWGIELVGQLDFPDHHPYSRMDILRLEQLAKDAGAESLVCTLKDFANFGSNRFTEMPVYLIRIELCVTREDAFWESLESIIARKRQEAGAAR